MILMYLLIVWSTIQSVTSYKSIKCTRSSVFWDGFTICLCRGYFQRLLIREKKSITKNASLFFFGGGGSLFFIGGLGVQPAVRLVLGSHELGGCGDEAEG